MIENFSRYQCFPSVGKIWDKKKKRFVEGCDNGHGYIIVTLQNDNGKWKTMLYHRAILMAYLGEGIPVGYEVNHIDECKTNNQIKNLNLMTPKENCNHGTRNKRVAKAQRNDPNRSKRVQAFDKQGNLVYDFPSSMEAQRQFGFNNGAIIACCKNKFNREGNNVYKGLIWRYVELTLDN